MSHDPLSPDDLAYLQKHLRHFRLVKTFRTHLEGVLANRTEFSASEADPRRILHAVDYFTMMLFAMYNPIVSTMRGLCQATHYGKVSEQISSAPVSISMFSDAQKVFTPELLDDVFASLLEHMPAGKAPRELARIKETLVMVDGTLFHTLKRMGWTEKGDRSRRGAKLHVQLDLRRNTPMAFQLTDARTCERKTLINMLQENCFYVGDRYYATGYKLMDEIIGLEGRSSFFVFRMQEKASYVVLSTRTLTAEDRAAGVVSDEIVELGSQAPTRQIRIVIVETEEGRFILGTNRMDLPAADIARIYRLRWEIEVYFKWLKCNLRIGHILAESQDGMAMQMYCALIMAMLLQLATGKRPTKRDLELIQFYQMGLVSSEEVEFFLRMKKKK